jgi:hypothetical protein
MSKIIRTLSVLTICVLVAISLSSCGGSADLTGSGSDAATIQGRVANSGSATATADDSVRKMSGNKSGIVVTVVGTGASTMTDAQGDFVISVPAGDVTLRFQGPGIDASLQIKGVAAGQTITITVQLSGSRAEIESEEVRDSCFSAGAKAEIEGKIESKTTDAIVVEQQGKGEFRAFVTTATRIRKGNDTLTLEDLRAGARVHVKGTGRGVTDGLCSVDATEIKLQ